MIDRTKVQEVLDLLKTEWAGCSNLLIRKRLRLLTPFQSLGPNRSFPIGWLAHYRMEPQGNIPYNMLSPLKFAKTSALSY